MLVKEVDVSMKMARRLQIKNAITSNKTKPILCALCPSKLTCQQVVRSDDVGARLNLVYLAFCYIICVFYCHFVIQTCGLHCLASWSILGYAALRAQHYW